VTRLHCPECGFQNLEAARYCEKCGAALISDESADSTQAMVVGEETVEDVKGALAETGLQGTAIIVRAGAGRVGETLALDRDQLTIGRSPDCDIFLDDITVSRKHALLLRRESGYAIEDQGSLNGTFVNRRRVDAMQLKDGDEVQIGKYKLTFLER
jgi:pSer/pThr/pTyr-binding forkhead associated (FHA) protein